jgi:hypothetical protein
MGESRIAWSGDEYCSHRQNSRRDIAMYVRVYDFPIYEWGNGRIAEL